MGIDNFEKIVYNISSRLNRLLKISGKARGKNKKNPAPKRKVNYENTKTGSCKRQGRKNP